MFEISKNILITLEIFKESKIYTIDNFYQDPDKILNFFLENSPNLFKQEQTPSYNGVYFEDRRHELINDNIQNVYNFLSFLCGQSPSDYVIRTNACRFIKCNFNNYYDNYWCPHQDASYVGIVYFNYGDEVSGTNLYEKICQLKPPRDLPEHFDPWKSKNDFKIIKTLYPRYNRLVLFDGKKFFHGMNICNDEYFGENYRLNQVFFFKE